MPRTVIINSFGDDFSSNVQVVDRPIPAPRRGEVLVRVTCRPVDPADIYSLTGNYPGFKPKRFPAVPGLEGCGVIHDNHGIQGLRLGQRVVVLFDAEHGNGSWQEYVCVPEENIIPIPDNVPDEYAAQFFVNPLTALGLLALTEPPQGSYVLQTAAGSTLGRLMVSIAAHKGLKTINLVRRDEHIQELKDLGADLVVNTEKAGDQLVSIIKSQTGGECAWAAFDCVGGEMTKTVASCVREGGKVLIYGMLSSSDCVIPIDMLVFKQMTFAGFWLPEFIKSLDDTARTRLFYEAMELMKNGKMAPRCGYTFPLDRIHEALRRSTEPGKPGKVLLTT